jgi:hypothetical protein
MWDTVSAFHSVSTKPDQAQRHLLEGLREDYQRRVKELAARVGSWAAVTPADAEAWGPQAEGAMRLLELAARREFCTDAVSARLVRALSPFGDDLSVDGACDADDGATLAALDVATLIGARWYLEAYGMHKKPGTPCHCGRERLHPGRALENWDGEVRGSRECTRWHEDDAGRGRVSIPPQEVRRASKPACRNATRRQPRRSGGAA